MGGKKTSKKGSRKKVKAQQLSCLVIYNTIEKSSPKGTDLSEEVNEVSLVARALRTDGIKVKVKGISRIDEHLVRFILRNKPTFIFNLCEALFENNENEMNIAGLFELLNIPYTGSRPFVLGLALDKIKSKQMLFSAGIPAPHATVAFPKRKFDLQNLKPPVIIKPSQEDGSNGITTNSVVWNPKDAVDRVDWVHKNFYQPAIIEEYIEGREVSVCLLGYPKPKVLAISEIDFSDFPDDRPKVMSYEAKWNPKSPEYEGTQIICPAELKSGTKRAIERIALKAFEELGCRDYGRVDFRITEDGRIYVLEVNPNSSIFPDSEFHEAAKSVKMNYADLIRSIAKCALKRAKKRVK